MATAATKSLLDKLSTITIMSCVLFATGLLAKRELSAPPDPSKPRAVNDWQAYAIGDERIGSLSAPVTITEFSDFQCPYCAKLFATLGPIIARHSGDVAIVFRNYPLKTHPFARPAAIAASCAAAQGRFVEYHDYLFGHQDSLSLLDWTRVAASVGVRDTSGFHQCLSSPEVARRLVADSTDARRLGVRGTPTVVVNGWLLPGTPTVEQLETYIEKARKH